MAPTQELFQHRTTYRPDRSSRLSPPSGLCYALIHRAFRDIAKGKDEEATDAHAWLNDSRFQPLSFTYCCHVMNLDPSTVRERGIVLKGPRIRGPLAEGGADDLFERRHRER
jgi:hypothetical protein